MPIVKCIAQHILSLLQLKQHRPLFVGIQGPQGSGKSYTSSLLQNYLSSEPLNLRVGVLSIDDLYLPHAGLRSLAESNPENRLWSGRGQPGTHDLDLGVRIFAALKEGQAKIELPRFDKSLHNGEGDRLPMDGSGVIISQPPSLDVVLLEGWCVGFYPIGLEEIERTWYGDWADESARLGIVGLTTLSDVAKINEKLHDYAKLWSFLDLLVQLKPSPKLPSEAPSKYSLVYKWRLEQEHYMKSHNGGIGMSDDAVKAFVDRYIPGYVFFGALDAKWAGRGLKIMLTEDRELVDFSAF
ncbi:hypothetical protein M378DRAFT_184684 [Amanita muscaria Koide BX008]|uniref:P-loop containing nucleoside triphosphate hydrolase protein n=1 Tax=Amanita muscaria (strain Koide BX008) TaxID=946122 RepID=A0A0C2XH76_AMAMK|nr:hypothetical protein M378DRAFT_184684 [Amanita muscaria Koide BX008]